MMMRNRTWVVVAGVVLACAGCESMQKKFTRKPKEPVARPSPVVSFRNYMEGTTPMERYRKHYAMFSYWNDQLITELQQRDVSPKRAKRASQGALQELDTLRDLLRDDAVAELQPIIQGWVQVDKQLDSTVTAGVQLKSTARILETQTRQLSRRFDWRKVEDRLKLAEDARAH
jgi:hypothetical protein